MLDLNELSKYRENNRIEAKKAAGGLPSSLWETYSAFANTAGGYILLGVEELPDKSLHAVGLPDPEKTAADFWNTINNRQKVSVNILTDKRVTIAESEGRRIVAIDVPRADRRDRPVYIGSDTFAGAYRRNGEGDYRCTKNEVRNMMRDQSDVSQDLRVLEHLGLDAFDYESVKRYRIRLKHTRPEHVWEKLEDVEFLQKLACVGRAEDGRLHPTAGGILMFGHEYEIIKEYSNYFLDYQEHDDDTTRWTDRFVSNTGDWSGNVFDFYSRVYGRMAQEVRIPFKLEGDTRIDDTPVHKALREALVNALTHANYYDRRGLVIHRRPKAITLANPGSLRISIDDALNGGVSDPRNITLMKMFNLLNIGERAGSGIPSIYAVWKHQGWEAPVLEERTGPDRVILSLELSQPDKKIAIKSCDKKSCGKNGATIGETKKQTILDYLASHGNASSGVLSSLLDVTPARVRALAKELVADGLVAVDGANRNRTYRLNDQ